MKLEVSDPLRSYDDFTNPFQLKVGLSGGYFNHPLQETTKYFKSMPEYLLLDGLQRKGVKVTVYGTKAYPLLKGLDVFNCHHESRTLQYLGLSKRYPYIVTLHNPFIASGFKPKLHWLTLQALHNAKAVVALSLAEKKQLMVDYKLNHHDIFVIPNGLKLELYKKPKRLVSRSKYGIPEDHKVILTVGQFLPYKNYRLLLKVFGKIARVNRKVTLIIKTLTPKPYEENKWFHVITERLTQQELTDLYHSCDLYVQPSKAEALCTCITEAMLCALPVVATDVGGTNTQITNGETGLLIPADNPQKLYDAITELLSDLDRADLIGKRAAEYAQRFNQETMVEKYLALYKNISRGK